MPFSSKVMPADRKLSTVHQVNPSTFDVIDSDSVAASGGADSEVGSTKAGTPDLRRHSVSEVLNHTLGLALFREEEDPDQAKVPTQNAFSGYTIPTPAVNDMAAAKKKADLGMMLGVYLPTIQHILGVTMFIRLFWVVGMAGVWHTMLLLLICCSCTLLTSISLSAVATNGVVEGGGAYFMISRNLGAEFGSAVGILFYLANTVATSMYLVGGVEVFLLYIYPDMTIGGEAVHNDVEFFGMMTNNYRIYGTLLLLLELVIVALGVKFVQLLAPISLACVILSILACFAGGIEKAVTHSGQQVCILDDILLNAKSYMNESHDLHRVCDLCTKNDHMRESLCGPAYNESTANRACDALATGDMECLNAFPGFNLNILKGNMLPMYMDAKESLPNVTADYDHEVFQDVQVTFFVLLAIYFPAVTGIMTGTNMSGDLADANKSIPRGTLAATITTSLIYFGLALLFGSSIIGPVLRDKSGKSLANSLVVAELSWPSPWVVIIGSFLSTFGAALQCLCSAPRLLQAIARDDVIPFLSPFSRVTKSNEPFLGLLLTSFIAECAILLGAVDSIAEVLDFFFLMCYAFVNLICALHSILGAPNWRPRFKYYHWSLSLAGAFLCFFIMFSSQYIYALIACGLTFMIYKYVEWKGAKKEWGDGIRGLALTTAQYSLLKVEDKDPHPKNFRPQIMLLVDGHFSKEVIDMRSVNIINLASQLKAGKGLAITVGFVCTNHGYSNFKSRAEEVKQRIQSDMRNSRLPGFGKALFYYKDQIKGCVSALYQSIGIGGLRPNTVLINFPRDDPMEHELFAEQLVRAQQNDYCVVVCKGIVDFPSPDERLEGHIDIWWMLHDGGILMLMAWLLTQNKVWRRCKLRIFVIADNSSSNTRALKDSLQKHIYMLRIDASVFIVTSKDTQQFTVDEDTPTPPTTANGYALSGDVAPLSGSRAASVRETGFTTHMSQVTLASENTEGAPMKESIVARKLLEAQNLNQVILEYSMNSQLVLLSLPSPPKVVNDNFSNYLSYCETLASSLTRVLLINGSGREVMTTAS